MELEKEVHVSVQLILSNFLLFARLLHFSN